MVCHLGLLGPPQPLRALTSHGRWPFGVPLPAHLHLLRGLGWGFGLCPLTGDLRGLGPFHPGVSNLWAMGNASAASAVTPLSSREVRKIPPGFKERRKSLWGRTAGARGRHGWKVEPRDCISQGMQAGPRWACSRNTRSQAWTLFGLHSSDKEAGRSGFEGRTPQALARALS